MRILNKLSLKQFSGNFHFIIFEVIIIAIFIKNNLLGIILFLLYYFIVIRYHSLKKELMFVFLIFLLMFKINYLIFNSLIGNGTNSLDGIVVDVNKKDNYNIITLRCKFEKILLYSTDSYIPGDILHVVGDVNEVEEKKYEGDFDYKEYLKCNYTYKFIYYPKVTKKKNIFVLERIKYEIVNYFQKRIEPNTFLYFKSLVFAENDFSKIDKQSFSNIGISHLFAISGLHITLIVIIMKYLLSKIFFDVDLVTKIIIVILSIYLILVGFNVSMFRAYLYFLIGYVVQCKNTKLTKLDIFSVVFLITIIINPRFIYQTGFIFSYMISFFLLITSDIFSRKSFFKRLILSSIVSIASVFPILTNINNSFNFLSVLLSPLFIIIFSYLIIPLCFLFLIVPNISFYIAPVYNFVSKIVYRLNTISIFNINIPFINIYGILLYYLFFVLILRQIRKRKINVCLILSNVCFILAIICVKYLDSSFYVCFFNCGQGDCIYISFPNNRGNILIDSYGKNASYLKSIGCRKLDYVFITHSDDDHMLTLNQVLETFPKSRLVYSIYDRRNLQKKNIDLSNSIRARGGDSFDLCDTKINVLSPLYDMDDTNNNSLVLSFEYKKMIFLFTGDITKKVEDELIKKYGNKLKSDVLKVAHHGSKTSSSIDFIKYVNPTYSIISVGANNKFGFPDKEVIKNLSCSKIYKTAENGSIYIKYKYNKWTICTNNKRKI